MEAVLERRESATPECRTLSVPQAAKVLGVSVTLAWKMAYSDQMRVRRFGRSVRVPVEEIERLLRGE